jgi:hypothetical protein
MHLPTNKAPHPNGLRKFILRADTCALHLIEAYVE